MKPQIETDITWTLAKIRARCLECGDCLLWQGGMRGCYPYCTEKLPGQAKQRRGMQRQVYVRRRVWEQSTGKPAPQGHSRVLTTTCKEPRCVAPEHLRIRKKSDILREAVQAGHFKSVTFRARVSSARSRDSHLSDADVAEIRSSSEPVKQLAARKGISLGYCYALRAGQARKDYTAPFAALQYLGRNEYSEQRAAA